VSELTRQHRAAIVARLAGLTAPARLAEQIGNTYVAGEDRFVVSLVVNYCVDEEVRNAHQAVVRALSLTSDEGSFVTQWYVYDRQTSELALIKQGEFDPASDERHPSLTRQGTCTSPTRRTGPCTTSTSSRRNERLAGVRVHRRAARRRQGGVGLPTSRLIDSSLTSTGPRRVRGTEGLRSARR